MVVAKAVTKVVEEGSSEQPELATDCPAIVQSGLPDLTWKTGKNRQTYRASHNHKFGFDTKKQQAEEGG